MKIRLLLLVLLPIFLVTKAQNIPEPKCSNISWRKAYKKANYLAEVFVTGLEPDGVDWFRVSYVEEYYFKRAQKAPHKLRISAKDFAKNPLIIGERYVVGTSNDGVLNNCNSFPVVDGGVPSGVLSRTKIPFLLLYKLVVWCDSENACQHDYDDDE